PGTGLEDELKALKANYSAYDFFFLHVKGTDSAGEDGDFERKVRIIEELDRAMPELIGTGPDVLIITGDHSTPAVLKGHSWHPVPLLLHSRWCRPDSATEFGESACACGGLGRFPATQIMPLAMAHALKLTKFGA
ncbi:MAG: phosphoglycerate mutase, partial [Dehalococcoidales bacterium]|nr:phosphoglycerate mutase [Dehalococcoidales bacterium]